jgi:putative CocE/NonD family hydrolase
MFLTSPAGDVGSGQLQTMRPDGKESFSQFVSDPADPVTNVHDSSGAHDYAKLSERPDVLTFDSSVLQQDTEVTGAIRVRMWVSCDCRDFDLWVRLLDVAPNGVAMNLMSPGLDVQRVSYRNLSRGRELISPGKLYELKLERLITSNVFLEGHRIRLQISAAFAPNFSRNLQTGKSEVNSTELKKAHIHVFHDASHPSKILLPILPLTR